MAYSTVVVLQLSELGAGTLSISPLPSIDLCRRTYPLANTSSTIQRVCNTTIL